MMEQTRPSAIVNSDLDAEQTTVADATVAELLTVCMARLQDERSAAMDDVRAMLPGSIPLADHYDPNPRVLELNGAARDLSTAITHIEDAITRANKAHYRLKGIFAITDAERSA